MKQNPVQILLLQVVTFLCVVSFLQYTAAAAESLEYLCEIPFILKSIIKKKGRLMCGVLERKVR